MTLTEFLLARIAEDEAAAIAVKPLEVVPVMGGPKLQSFGHSRHDYAAEDGYPRTLADNEAAAHFARHDPARVLAECEAKRRIVELHQAWPVLVQTPPTVEQIESVDSFAMRARQQMAWLTEQEYRAKFGDEPPTSPIIRALALPYAVHPDYRDEWRP